jgi:hypothetical protein
MKRHHRILVLVALAVTVAAWIAWSMLMVESDLQP